MAAPAPVSEKEIVDATVDVFQAANKIPATLPHRRQAHDAAMQHRDQALKALQRGNMREVEDNLRALRRLKAEVDREWRR